MESFLERYRPLLRHYAIPLLIGCVGLILCGYGLLSMLGKNEQKSDVVFTPATANASEPQQTQIMIDIAGAVVKPGVYAFSQGARLQDVLIKAGGLSENADREKISRTINLAVKVTDGMKVYFPAKEDKVLGASDMKTDQDGLIDINSASSQVLEGLPGVGAVTSQKIVAGRPYSTIEELKTKKVVSAKIFEQIKGSISTY